MAPTIKSSVSHYLSGDRTPESVKRILEAVVPVSPKTGYPQIVEFVGRVAQPELIDEFLGHAARALEAAEEEALVAFVYAAIEACKDATDGLSVEPADCGEEEDDVRARFTRIIDTFALADQGISHPDSDGDHRVSDPAIHHRIRVPYMRCLATFAVRAGMRRAAQLLMTRWNCPLETIVIERRSAIPVYRLAVPPEGAFIELRPGDEPEMPFDAVLSPLGAAVAGDLPELVPILLGRVDGEGELCGWPASVVGLESDKDIDVVRLLTFAISRGVDCPKVLRVLVREFGSSVTMEHEAQAQRLHVDLELPTPDPSDTAGVQGMYLEGALAGNVSLMERMAGLGATVADRRALVAACLHGHPAVLDFLEGKGVDLAQCAAPIRPDSPDLLMVRLSTMTPIEAAVNLGCTRTREGSNMDERRQLAASLIARLADDCGMTISHADAVRLIQQCYMQGCDEMIIPLIQFLKSADQLVQMHATLRTQVGQMGYSKTRIMKLERAYNKAITAGQLAEDEE